MKRGKIKHTLIALGIVLLGALAVFLGMSGISIFRDLGV